MVSHGDIALAAFIAENVNYQSEICPFVASLSLCLSVCLSVCLCVLRQRLQRSISAAPVATSGCCGDAASVRFVISVRWSARLYSLQ